MYTTLEPSHVVLSRAKSYVGAMQHYRGTSGAFAARRVGHGKAPARHHV